MGLLRPDWHRTTDPLHIAWAAGLDPERLWPEIECGRSAIQAFRGWSILGSTRGPSRWTP